MAQVYDDSHIIRNLQYDPYGQVSEKSTGVNEYDIFYGFNSEEYNPVAETQYLRARYYTPDTGSFISRDTILGSVGNLNSQNRYTYAENDPINNTDPSGHSIAVSSYARNMAANSMIDEILIMEVAGTLIQNENKAKAAFSSQLYKAQAVSYQDIQAIRNISGISQATADYFIKNGGLAALKAAINLNCVPGEIVNGTIRMFEANVNAAKTSVNAQIDSVKANKIIQHDDWVASEVARMSADLDRHTDSALRTIISQGYDPSTSAGQQALQNELFRLLGGNGDIISQFIHLEMYAAEIGKAVILKGSSSWRIGQFADPYSIRVSPLLSEMKWGVSGYQISDGLAPRYNVTSIVDNAKLRSVVGFQALNKVGSGLAVAGVIYDTYSDYQAQYEKDSAYDEAERQQRAAIAGGTTATVGAIGLAASFAAIGLIGGPAGILFGALLGYTIGTVYNGIKNSESTSGNGRTKFDDYIDMGAGLF